MFESAAELLDLSADELADLVKERDKPGAINLGHSAFDHPRKYWEKILTSKHFDDIGRFERAKLLMLHPGIEPEVKLETMDNDLRASLPQLEYLC